MDPNASTTIYLRTRDGAVEALPPIPTLNGIPLLSLSLAPSRPVDIGVQVYARLLGPRSNGPARNPGSPPPPTSLELGLEGRVIAIRRADEICAEMVVRNGSWAKMRYAAVLLHAIPGVTIKESLWDSLRTPAPQNQANEDNHPAYTTCYRATRCGQEAAVLADYPPVREDPLPDGNTCDSAHWASNAELCALGRALGGTFQTGKIKKEGRGGKEERRRAGRKRAEQEDTSNDRQS